MANLEEVPVIDVEIDNIQELWPTILLAVRSSSFVAIDTELSGLGERRQLNAKELDQRYIALTNVAKTRSILSVGLSCFKHDKFTDQKAEQKKELSFQCQTFNILMLCSEDYMVEPRSLKFLVNHNFDFNRQYAKGIPYYRGQDQEKPADRQWMRELLQELMSNQIPVVLHNAYVDLGFLYQSFHTELPATIGTFLADLTEVFPGGVYDTKYIAEFQARHPASYLEYVFRKCQRDNQELFARGQRSMHIQTLNYPASCTFISHLPCSIPTHADGDDRELCVTYAAHGWCKDGVKCAKSHDIGRILDADEKLMSNKKRKRKRKGQGTTETESEPDTRPDYKETSVNMDVQLTEEKGSNGLAGIDVNTIQSNSRAYGDTADKIQASSEGLTNTKPDQNQKLNEFQGRLVSTNAHQCQGNRECTNRGRTAGHRACFDAFMTGFIFAHFIHRHGKPLTTEDATVVDGMVDFVNRITFTGKDIPLRIVQSNFTKTSKAHALKMAKLKALATLQQLESSDM